MHGSSATSSDMNRPQERTRPVDTMANPKLETVNEFPQQTGDAFDYSAPPPFTIADLRAAIPKHCWQKSTARSISYLIRDVVVVLSLGLTAAYVNSWLIWPIYWALQGTMFWALFVVGHDCGHGSFSSNQSVNYFVGHLTHSFILVPFHGWRISHRTHHANHGHVENDESWYPITESTYQNLDGITKFGRLTLPGILFVFPAYLWVRGPVKSGSHYHPESPLFTSKDRNDVLTSTVCWATMVSLLLSWTATIGPMWMLKLYVVPYLVNIMWLTTVTYLHHHGFDKKVPWYRGKEWSYLRGGLSTIDRDYGWINNIHHDIGTHVVHHLFPAIPHYHLKEACEAIKPILGNYYRVPEKSGPLPVHLIATLLQSFSEDHYVSDEGDIVFYQKDPNFKTKIL